MAKQASLFAAFSLLVSVGNPFANCVKVQNVTVSDTSDKRHVCAEKCESPKPCECDKPIPIAKCDDFFGTMSRYEFLKIFDRICRSGNRNVQNASVVCYENAPARLLALFKECALKIVGCYYGPEYYDAMAINPLLALGIYECIEDKLSVSPQTPEEKKELLVFEKCIQEVDPGCGGPY